MFEHKLLLTALRVPSTLATLPLSAWQGILTLGRRHGVSGRWYGQLSAAGLLEEVPAAVQRHQWSDQVVAANHVRAARWELNRLAHVFATTGVSWTLLKGAAYIAAELPPGDHRLLSDVDILVPEASLDVVEALLLDCDWRSPPHDEYDDHYYRAWMHELPPLQHRLRGTVLDVHHNILPRTSPHCPDAAELIARRVPLPDGLFMLAPADAVLHSVLHGFWGGELTNCLRDVLDVHELVQAFGQRLGESFWLDLQTRAQALQAVRPLLLALHQAEQNFGTLLPPDFLRTLKQCDRLWIPRALTNALIGEVFLPTLPPNRREKLALKALLLRSHLLKMPLRLLLPHLNYKLGQRLAARAKTRRKAAQKAQEKKAR